jgi:hypothetical protein
VSGQGCSPNFSTHRRQTAHAAHGRRGANFRAGGTSFEHAVERRFVQAPGMLARG